jgi:hypothetical protein
MTEHWKQFSVTFTVDVDSACQEQSCEVEQIFVFVISAQKEQGVPSIFRFAVDEIDSRGSQLGRQVYETPESVSDSGVNIKDSGVNF